MVSPFSSNDGYANASYSFFLPAGDDDTLDPDIPTLSGTTGGIPDSDPILSQMISSHVQENPVQDLITELSFTVDRVDWKYYVAERLKQIIELDEWIDQFVSDYYKTVPKDLWVTQMVSLLEQIPDDHPKASDFRTKLGNSLFKEWKNLNLLAEDKGYGDVLSEIEKVIRVKDDYPYAWVIRGAVLGHQGKLEAAIADYTRAIKLKPGCARAFNNRGFAFEKQGKLEAAIADYTRAIELEPEDATAFKNRGFAFVKQGKLEAAIADCTRAIELKPGCATTFNNRGFAFVKQGKLQAAIADYTRAIELNPEYALAFNNRGFAFVKQGKLKAAIADYTRAIELNPEYALAFNNRGGVYRHQGNLKAAIADYRQAIRLRPEWASTIDGRIAELSRMVQERTAKADRDDTSMPADSSSTLSSSSSSSGVSSHIRPYSKPATIVARYFRESFVGESRSVTAIGRSEKVACYRCPFGQLKLKGGGALPSTTTKQLVIGDGWNIEHLTTNPKGGYERLSFVHLGRGKEGFMPTKPVGKDSRVIAVLSGDQRDLAGAFVAEGYDVLIVNEMDDSTEKRNFLIPRRLTSLFFAEHVGAKDLIFLDDNIQDLFVSHHIGDHAPTWEGVYDFYREAARDCDQTLLSTESIGGHQRELPTAKEMIVKEGAFGAKLTYVNLEKLRRKKIPLRQLFPSESKMCLENHFLHFAIRALGLKSGAVSRKSIVLQRNGQNPGSCSSVELPANRYLESDPPRDWRPFHKKAFQMMKKNVLREQKRHEGVHERGVSDDLFDRTTGSPSSGSDGEGLDLSREGKRREKKHYLPRTELSRADVEASVHSSKWLSEVAVELNRTIESMPTEEQLREPQREALKQLSLMHQHQAKRGYIELPTGVGKTRIIAASIAAAMRSPSLNKPVLVISPKLDLTKQMFDDLKRLMPFFKTEYPIVQVDSSTTPLRKYINSKSYTEKPKHVVVMCAKTAHAYLSQGGDPGYVIVDEIHKIPENIYPLMNETRPRLGLSATPGVRAKHFQDPDNEYGGELYTYSIEEAVENGYLCPWVTRSVTVQGPDVEEREWLKHVPEVLKQVDHPESGHVSDHPSAIYTKFADEANSVAEEDENALAYHSYKIHQDEIRDTFADDDKLENSVVAVRGLVEGSNFPKLRTVVVTNKRKEDTVRQILGRCLRLDADAPDKKALLLIFDTTVVQNRDFPESLVCPERLSGISSKFGKKRFTVGEYNFTVNDKISYVFRSSLRSSAERSPSRSPTRLSADQLEQAGIPLRPLESSSEMKSQERSSQSPLREAPETYTRQEQASSSSATEDRHLKNVMFGDALSLTNDVEGAAFTEGRILGDGDCGFSAINTTRREVIKFLLMHADNSNIRNLVAPEIAAWLVGLDLQGSCLTKRVKDQLRDYHNHHHKMDAMARGFSTRIEEKTGIKKIKFECPGVTKDNILLDWEYYRTKIPNGEKFAGIKLSEHFINTYRGHLNQAKAIINKLSRSKEVYQTYVNEWYARGRYMMLPDPETTGVINVIASWKRTPTRVWKLDKSGDENGVYLRYIAGEINDDNKGRVIDMIHRDKPAHFNRLIPRGEFESFELGARRRFCALRSFNSVPKPADQRPLKKQESRVSLKRTSEDACQEIKVGNKESVRGRQKAISSQKRKSVAAEARILPPLPKPIPRRKPIKDRVAAVNRVVATQAISSEKRKSAAVGNRV